MNIYDGTHMFIWEADKVCGGNAQKIIAQAKANGMHGVLIKFADGSLNGDPVSQEFMRNFKALIGPLQVAGLTVGGWIYQYFNDVQGEVDACTQAIQAGADWIVLDGEIHVRTQKDRVAQFGQLYRERHPHVVTALSSFAIADYHPEVCFEEYAKFVDVMMPQIYWAEMKWPLADAFNKSVESYKKYGKPIAPTGQSYLDASTADMARFVQMCKDAGFSHVSWWDWQQASTAQMAAVKANCMPRLVAPPAPTPTPINFKLQALNEAKQVGIIKSDEWLTKLDEPAPVWFVIVLVLNAIKYIGGKR